ncbi:MAG: hypothetical protein ACLTLQ_18000 [[Clostridium] scindens]
MERNRKDYNETADCYRDTGYDRYWDKMERLEKEYEELKSFLGLNSSTQNASAESTRLYAENKELKDLSMMQKPYDLYSCGLLERPTGSASS